MWIWLCVPHSEMKTQKKLAMLTWDIKILTVSQGFNDEFKQGGFSFVFTSELEELPSQTMKRDTKNQSNAQLNEIM